MPTDRAQPEGVICFERLLDHHGVHRMKRVGAREHASCPAEYWDMKVCIDGSDYIVGAVYNARYQSMLVNALACIKLLHSFGLSTDIDDLSKTLRDLGFANTTASHREEAGQATLLLQTADVDEK